LEGANIDDHAFSITVAVSAGSSKQEKSSSGDPFFGEHEAAHPA
jgi:hypothetical protein